MTALAASSAALDHAINMIRTAPEVKLTEAERKDSEAAKKKVREKLDLVAKYCANKSSTQAVDAVDAVQSLVADVQEKFKQTRSVTQAKMDTKKHLPTIINQDPNLAFMAASETNLSSVASSTQDLSGSITSIIPTFNKILATPDLETYSALLNNVTAIGILNSTVQYMSASIHSDGKVHQSWDRFDDLPATPSTGDTTSIFSYNGKLYVAIGENLWSKTPLDPQNPFLLKAATDNWSKAFGRGWSSLGSCLGENNATCLIPYSVFLDGAVNSWLFKLSADGSMSYSTNTLSPDSIFTPLPATEGQTVSLVKAAYLNGCIWGYDSSGILYELSINSSESNLTGYQIKSQQTLDKPITDLAAIDTGLVVAPQDRNLYRLITSPTASAGSPPTQTWTKWVARGGVTNLGVASIGMILDMRTLSSLLLNEYTSTQTQLVPYINQMLAFCSTHKIYLSNLMDASTAYANATTQQQKVDAEAVGTTALNHCKIWGQLLSTSLTSAGQMVTALTNELSGIQLSINVQLQNISDKLTTLKETLEIDEKQYGDFVAELVAAVAVAVTVIGIGIFLAGAIVPGYAQKVEDLAGNVAATKTSIANMTSSHDNLMDINTNFANLKGDFGNLDAFWGNLLDTSNQVTDLEDLGAFILQDPSSIQAAQADVLQIQTNLQTYLTALNSQGVPPTQPSSFAKLPEDLHTLGNSDLEQLVEKLEPDAKMHKFVKLEIVERMLGVANKSHADKDVGKYLSIMSRAVDWNSHLHEPLLKSL